MSRCVLNNLTKVIKKATFESGNGFDLGFRFISISSILFLSGCVWSGFQPVPQSYSSIGVSPGPVVTLQNFDDENFRTNAVEAIKFSRLVIEHPDFKNDLIQQSLLPTCKSDNRLSGTEVFESLSDARPFSLAARKPWRAVAVANIGKQRVAVKKSRFRNWNGTQEQRGQLIETLVHEMTHMVPASPETLGDTEIYSKYTDRGHGTELCPDEDLVSYYVGSLAKKVYLANYQQLNP